MSEATTPLRYLVTGAAGNLARQLVEQLRRQGHAVHALDLQAAEGVEACDVSDRASMRAMLERHRPQRMLHMASMLSRSSEEDPERAWEVNATASVHLMQDAIDAGVEQFFFPSTNATYAGSITDPMPEDEEQWPSLVYGVTKVAVERMGVYLHHKHGFDFRAVRLPIVLSPYAPSGAATAYASHAFVAAANGEEFVFPVSEEVGASSIYVRDVIEGILRFVDAPGEGLSRRIYNLHSFAPTAAEVAKAIVARVPDFRYRFEPEQLAMDMIVPLPSVIVDWSARKDWQWEPRFNMAATAADFLQALGVPSR